MLTFEQGSLCSCSLVLWVLTVNDSQARQLCSGPVVFVLNKSVSGTKPISYRSRGDIKCVQFCKIVSVYLTLCESARTTLCEQTRKQLLCARVSDNNFVQLSASNKSENNFVRVNENDFVRVSENKFARVSENDVARVSEDDFVQLCE